jgi:D-3-phosphoglycerate dehydrogenase
MKIVLTSPSSFGQISNEPFDLLKKNGFEIINNPFGRKLNENEVIDLAKNCIGIVAGVEPLTKKVIDALPNLKCISRVGVMKKRTWKKQTGSLLCEKKVGVIGLGRIGKRVAELFRGLGNEVLGYDLYPDNTWADKNNVIFVEKNELLKKSDIITLHIPESTSPFIGKDEIILMKNSIFLVNVARGGVVDEQELFEALKNNKLAGAAIDVFSTEPYNGPLCDLQNVILTPHIGSYAKEGKLKMEIKAVKNLLDVLNRNLNG